jgi:hypothetical protein
MNSVDFHFVFSFIFLSTDHNSNIPLLVRKLKTLKVHLLIKQRGKITASQWSIVQYQCNTITIVNHLISKNKSSLILGAP